MGKSSPSFAAFLTLAVLIAAIAVSALGMVDFMFFIKNKFVFWLMAASFVISILCLAIVLRKDRSSGIMFYLIMLIYAIELVATGIVVPLLVWPGAVLKCSVVALSAIVFIGIVVFNLKWRNYSMARPLISVLIAVELCISFATFFAFKDAFFADSNLILWSAFMRPVILGSTALSYFYHMRARNYIAD